MKIDNTAALKSDDQHSELRWWTEAELLASPDITPQHQSLFPPALTARPLLRVTARASAVYCAPRGDPRMGLDLCCACFGAFSMTMAGRPPLNMD